MKKILSLCLALCMALSLALPVLADETGGARVPDTSWWTGRQEGQTEFRLSTADQLAGLIYLSNTDVSIKGTGEGMAFDGLTFYLENDIDMQPYSGMLQESNGNYAFQSTPAYASLAGGTVYYANFTLDGQGNSIKNFTFTANENYSDRTAFICGMSNKAAIRNLVFSNCNAVGASKMNAVVVGQSRGTIQNVAVENCLVFGPSDYSGGIAGRNSGLMEQCRVTNVTLDACSYAGAFAGIIQTDQSSPSAVCRGCTATNVQITGNYHVAGIIGQITSHAGEEVLLQNNSFAGQVTGRSKNVGLLVGLLEAEGGAKVVLQGCRACGTLQGGDADTTQALIGVGTAELKHCAAVWVSADQAGQMAISPDGTTILPAGSQAVLSGGGTATVGQGRGKMTAEGTILLPGGSLWKDKNGDTVLEQVSLITNRGILVQGTASESPGVGPDGTVEVPRGGFVIDEDGQKTAMPYGGTVSVDGTIRENSQGSAPGPVVPDTAIALDKTELSLEPGQTAKLKASLTPADATYKYIFWESSDETVATVSDSGLVTAIADGTVTITAKSWYGHEAVCAVAVKTPEPPTPVDPWPTEGLAGFVTRCYRVTLSRDPDKAGHADWVRWLQDGTVDATTCTYGFVFSKEMNNKDLSDEAFVKTLYNLFMDREGEAIGVAFWTDYLKAGHSREEVFHGFADSTEFACIKTNYGIQ